jgi:carboxyl-terminal processing protease
MKASRPGLAKNLIGSLIGIVLVLPTMAAGQDRTGQDRPAMVDDRPVQTVQGVWRSRGYGYVVNMGPDGPTLFHVAGDYCYADPREERDPDSLFSYYRVLGRDTLAFSGEIGQTRIVFDRLPEMPRSCLAGGGWSPARIASLTAATFADLYPSFKERGIDWRARTAAISRVLNETTDDAALFKTLRTLLAGVEDPHVELEARVAGQERELQPGDGPTLGRLRSATGISEREWQPAYRRGILDSVLQGKGHQAASGSVVWGRIGEVGYLNLLSMGGDEDAMHAALDQAFVAFKGTRAVIVDITNNRGGYDSLGQQIAGRFADRRRLAYTKVAFGAEGVDPQPFHVEPSKRSRYLGQVYLLTSDVTLSAAEVFALYMRALPNVIQIGGTTRGAFSDMIEKPLPNGWTLNMSAEVYRDPSGESYEVRGLPPHIKREVFPPNNLTGGHARAVQALVDDIRRDDHALKVAPSNPTQ